MQQQTRKRRKWDDTGASNNASPAAPIVPPRAADPPNSGFVPGSIFSRNAASNTSALKFEPVKPKMVTKPGEPMSADAIARFQQEAALAMEKINKVLLIWQWQ
jgi:hypothetical protein